MDWLETKIPPPIVLLVVAIAMWLGHRFLGGGLAEGTLFYLGVAAMVMGFGQALNGLFSLRRNHTTPSPTQIDQAKVLVTSGIYQYSRNPMYLGMVLFLMGLAALMGKAALLSGPILFALYITRFQIVPEERMMRAKFGAGYEAYRARVRRWI